jgi:predicted MFS family arabinose efflux permease
MAAPTLPRLATTIIGAHTVDQIVLALVPLALTAANVEPRIIATAVAAQTAAWLIVTLPAGVIADRYSRRTIMGWGALLVLAGSLLAAAVMTMTVPSALWLGLAAFVTSSGVVLLVLSVFALLPKAVGNGGLARSNSVFEFGRALAAIGAPTAVGYLITQHMTILAPLAAAVAAVAVLIAVYGLDDEPPVSTSRLSVVQSVRDGAAFVLEQPILRAIASCAIFWNIAFITVTAIFPPYAVKVLGLTVGDVATAWSVYGIGLLLGAAIAPWAIARVHTGVLFVIGPLGSTAGILCLSALAPIYGMPAVLIGFFSIGFLPMIWLVLQTSVRQIVTPTPLLARVAATISTTIYGIRPIGALIAGLVAANFGLTTAMWFGTLMFTLSAVAILISPAPAMKVMPVGATAT